MRGNMPFTTYETVSLILVVASLYLTWRLQRPLKRDLNYDVLGKFRAAAADRTQLVDMGISVADAVLDLADLVLVRFVSAGLGAIREADFGAPLELVFEQGALVMEAVVVQKRPPNLRVDVTTHRNVVLVSTRLLNPSDSFDLAILVPKDCPSPVIQAHIEGASEVISVQDAKRRRLGQVAYGLGVVAIAVLNLVGAYLYARQSSFGLSDLRISIASVEFVVPIWALVVFLVAAASVWLAMIFAATVSRLNDSDH